MERDSLEEVFIKRGPLTSFEFIIIDFGRVSPDKEITVWKEIH
jgi:hypothetical protein